MGIRFGQLQGTTHNFQYLFGLYPLLIIMPLHIKFHILGQKDTMDIKLSKNLLQGFQTRTLNMYHNQALAPPGQK